MRMKPFVAGTVVAALIGAFPLAAFADDGSAVATPPRSTPVAAAIMRAAASYPLQASAISTQQGGSAQTPMVVERRHGKQWIWWALIGAGAGFATGYFVKEGGGGGDHPDSQQQENNNNQ